MKVITHIVTHQKKKTDIDTHTIMYQAKSAGRHIESKMYPANLAGRYSHSIMYPANFAGGRSRLDLLLPSFLPSREEKKIQDRKNRPLGCRGVSHTPPEHLGRDEQRAEEGRRCPRERCAIWQDNFRRTRNEKPKMKALRTSPYRGPTTFQERFQPLEYLKYPFCNACPSWARAKKFCMAFAQLGQEQKSSTWHLPNLGKSKKVLHGICPSWARAEKVCMTFAQVGQALKSSA